MKCVDTTGGTDEGVGPEQMQESSRDGYHSGPGQEVAERMERRKLSQAPLESETYETVMGQVGGAEMDGKESAVKLWFPSLCKWSWGLGTSVVSMWRHGASCGRLGAPSSKEILMRALLAQQQSKCGPGGAPWRRCKEGP